ncbi:DUF397 domain-containing protein [Streptomyces sp. NPDC051994]|uniref:DUF397 domain-containing protein n=1 Tax=unclassified Streptomyces TaxID=2593676 RepID=UPI003423EF10
MHGCRGYCGSLRLPRSKSSYSEGSGTECVEAARLATRTAVRDSKRPEGPRISFSATTWIEFVGALKGEGV